MNILRFQHAICLAVLAALPAGSAMGTTTAATTDTVVVEQKPETLSCYDRAQLEGALIARDHQVVAVRAKAAPGWSIEIFVNAKGQWAQLMLPSAQPDRACPYGAGTGWALVGGGS